MTIEIMEILRNAIRRIAIFNELHAWKTRYFVKNNRFRIEKPKMDKEPSISPLYPTRLIIQIIVLGQQFIHFLLRLGNKKIKNFIIRILYQNSDVV